MTQIARQKPARRRLFVWLVVLALLAAGWSWAWYRAAGVLDGQVDRMQTDASAAGAVVACPGHRVEGFPFSIALACDSVSLADTAAAGFDGGALRAAWRLWEPLSVSARLEAPLTARPGDGPILTANWNELTTRIGFNLKGPRQFDVAADGLSLHQQATDRPFSADIRSLDLTASLASADAETPVRPGAMPVDIRLKGEEIAITTAIAVPAFSLSADLHLDDVPSGIGPGFDLMAWLRANGLSGTFRDAAFVTTQGGTVTLAGPFSISTDGLLGGRLDVAARDFAAITAFLAEFVRDDPKRLKQLRQASAILAGLGNGQRGASLRLSIARGEVVAGFLPLGRIPPLF